MLLILYPPGLNWFYETIARSLHEELALEGHASQLITPAEFIAADAERFDDNRDVLMVNAFECAHSLGGPTGEGRRNDAVERLRDRMRRFRRRILLNLDGIHTTWFSGHMTQVKSMLTDIFDICMTPQTDRPRLSGCRYHWIQESFTDRELRHLLPHDTQRPLVWSMIGHSTRDRIEMADMLVRTVSPAGFLFMPGLRPCFGEGSRNLSPEALDRVLQKTQYYIWTSHHRFPYHEGLRALHAVKNGAIPVKIDPLFTFVFHDVPWVYESIDAFKKAIEVHGHDGLFRRALDHIVSRGTLGTHVARALYGQPHCAETGSPIQLSKAES